MSCLHNKPAFKKTAWKLSEESSVESIVTFLKGTFPQANQKSLLITLQQEAEHVEQEKDAGTVQVGEESFIIHDGKLMGGDIADYVRYTDDDKQQRVD